MHVMVTIPDERANHVLTQRLEYIMQTRHYADSSLPLGWLTQLPTRIMYTVPLQCTKHKLGNNKALVIW